MKKFLAILLALVMVFGVVACTSTPEPTPAPETTATTEQATEETTTTEETAPPDPGDVQVIKLMTWGEWDAQDIADFEEWSGAKLVIQTVDWDAFNETFMASVMANEAADAIEIHAMMVAPFLNNNLLLPLDGLIDFKSPIWEKFANYELIMRDGKHMAAVIDSQLWYHFFYNVAMFEDEGLESPASMLARGAWTWDNMFDTARLLTRDTMGSGENDFVGLSSEGFHMLHLLMMVTYNEHFIYVDENGEYHNNIDSPQIANIMNKIYNLSMVDGAYAGDFEMFKSGNAAMFLGGYWYMWEEGMSEMLQNRQIAMVPMPTPGGKIDDLRDGAIEIYGIPRNAANPEGGALLIEWLRYQATLVEENTLELMELGFTEEEVSFIFDLPTRVNETSLVDWEWWNPMYAFYEEDWSTIREWARGEAQLVVDNLNSR